MGKRKRSRLWVDSAIQGALSRRVVLHWLLLISVTLALAVLMQFFSDPTKSFSHHVRNVLWQQRIFLIVVAALVPVFVRDTIKLSNRFAGPIFRLRETLSNLAAGKPVEKLGFRGTDFWSELATSFNKAVDLGYMSTTRANESSSLDSSSVESTTSAGEDAESPAAKPNVAVLAHGTDANVDNSTPVNS